VEYGVVDQEAYVGDSGDVRVDDRVPGAVDRYVEAGCGELVAFAYRVDSVAQAGQLAGDRRVRPDFQGWVGVGCCS